MRTQFDRQVARYTVAYIVNSIRMKQLDKSDTKELCLTLARMFAHRHRVGYTKHYQPFWYE